MSNGIALVIPSLQTGGPILQVLVNEDGQATEILGVLTIMREDPRDHIAWLFVRKAMRSVPIRTFRYDK